MSKKKWNKPVKEEAHADGSATTTYVQEEVAQEPKLDFDAWLALRGPRIPKHHHKEILRADFSARGLGQCESLADFDSALNQYGVKLS